MLIKIVLPQKHAQFRGVIRFICKKADFPTRKQILEIFIPLCKRIYWRSRLLVVSELLLYLEKTPGKFLDEALKEALIETILNTFYFREDSFLEKKKMNSWEFFLIEKK